MAQAKSWARPLGSSRKIGTAMAAFDRCLARSSIRPRCPLRRFRSLSEAVAPPAVRFTPFGQAAGALHSERREFPITRVARFYFDSITTQRQ